MTTIEGILKRYLLVNITLTAGLIASAQPSNKPTAITQASATGTIATRPSDYTTGIKINYIRTWDAMGRFSTGEELINAGYADRKEATQYFDGLGRPLQTIARQSGPGATPKDLVVPVVYDDFGREVFKYLPYVQSNGTTNDGAFKLNAFTDQDHFYKNVYKDATDQLMYAGEQALYSRTEFEPSPLNRVQKTFAPGNSWAGSYNPSNPSTEKATNQQYLVNTPTEDNVRIWDITNNLLTYTNNDVGINIPASRTDPYSAGELYKNVMIDEHGNAVVEYKDKEGKVILKKAQSGSIASDYSGYTNFLCTYYIYDDLNQLRFVIPPKAVDAIKTNWTFNDDIINELCFRYEYDERQRMIAKKVPGAGWVYLVYDKRDRLVFTQDANLRTPPSGGQGGWMATLYDQLNRPVMTGMITYSGNRTALQDYVNAQTITTSSTPISGTTTSGILADISFTQRETGRINYQATSSIEFLSGFETETGAGFIAEIVTGGGSSFSENITVMGSPLPTGHNFIALTITYYDDYSWTNKTYTTAYNNKLDAGTNPHMEALPSQASTGTRGMATGTKVRILENPNNLAAGAFMTTVSFYDEKARVIQLQSENYKGGTDITTNLYDFTGKVLSNYMVHNNSAGAQVRVQTNTEYDHAGRLLETWKIINDETNKKALIAKNEYDELGQLKRKELGKKKDVNGSYTSDPLEKLDYTYNIRGWLKGINKYYAGKHSTQETDRWFGMELNYDWGFDNNQFNGNIAGTKWRSKGDGEQRAYGFGYDKVNRILFADFNQYTSGWNRTAGLNFSSYMGDGIDATSAYDANGNIKGMKQWGLKGVTSAVIDEMSYAYLTTNENSNKLKSVTESSAIATTDNKLGDFTDLNRDGSDDYLYDANGNLTKDKNKKLGLIKYNHLNLPYNIDKSVTTGYGTIEYVYDATGNKLKKLVRDGTGSPRKTIVTEYVSGFIYEGTGSEAGVPAANIKLQFFSHEEGRVRYTEATGTQPEKWSYDYFVKDHLGNTRVVLTDEQQKDMYPMASMESAHITAQEIFYANINSSSALKPSNYPADNTIDPDNPESPNERAAKLEGDINRIGPAIVLKVMAGDKINLRANSWYDHNGTELGASAGPVLTEIVSALINGIPGKSGGKVGSSDLTSSLLSPGVSAFLTARNSTLEYPYIKARAWVNVLMLDDQFKPVITNDGKNSWFDQVGADEDFKEHSLQGREITKNGYLYIYVSNETHHQPVYFDNLQVTHIRGPLLEETHYYPFGLTMSGISSKALAYGNPANKHLYSGKEKQDKEFSNGSGLEWYYYGARMLDVQIGRWHSIDPLAEHYKSVTPYNFCLNDPMKYIDVDGRDIIIVTSSGNFKVAKETLLKTKAGTALWQKYAKSKSHDVYITIGHISSATTRAKTNYGFTYDTKKFDVSPVVTNGKIHISDPSFAQDVLNAFEGIDISKSKGRKVSFVLLNETSFDESNPLTEGKINETNFVNNPGEIPFSLAEIIYHEFKAHIDLHGRGGAAEHAAYGRQYSGVFNRNYPPAPNTPAHVILQQLYEQYLKGFMDHPSKTNGNNPNPPINPNIANKM